ncbi:MAG: hypothetical protein EOO28_11635 [Comamonadaceae bacterium]|nr:MAG: hypothetical protein EOO28_11635 [Comamonadaceae bacterium]
MTLPRMLQLPGFVQLGIRIDTAPAWWWLAAQLAALWPTWIWMLRRLADGNDDPLGVIGLIALGWFVWQGRAQLRAAPRLDWLLLALAGTFAAALADLSARQFAAGLLAVGALAAGALAFAPGRLSGMPPKGLTANTFVNRVAIKALFIVGMLSAAALHLKA